MAKLPGRSERAPGRTPLLKWASAARVALIVVAVLVAVTAGPVHASQRAVNEASLLELVNSARTHRGLAPLRPQAALHRAALAHSREMMRRHYFSHWSAGGASYETRVRRAGYSKSGWRYWAVSEVIGWGRRSAGTPRAVFRSWMRSSYHRAIILGRRWRDAGIGCASGTFGGASGSWVYTLDLGRRSR